MSGFNKDSFWHRGKRQLENGLFSDFPVPISLAIGDSYPYLGSCLKFTKKLP